MAKRKAGTKKKGVPHTTRRRSSRLVRLWQRHARTVARVAAIAAAAFVVLVAVYLTVSKLGTASRAGEVADHVTQAREALLRNQFETARLAYHQAGNADPDDPALKREQTMFQQRLALAQGGTLRNAIAAAYAVVANDSSSTIGWLVLGQLNNNLGNLTKVLEYGTRALRLANDEEEKCSQIAASVLLGSYFRQREQFDSAYHYAGLAVDLAEVTQDTFDLLVSGSGLAYAALGLDSLERAAGLLRETEARAQAAYPGFVDLADAGLADYFRRIKQDDSALSYANLVLGRNPVYKPNPTAALAAQVAGQVLTRQGKYEEAEMRLQGAAAAWRAIAGYTDLITTYNALADLNYRREDFAAARKYYLVATRVAESFGLGTKGQYDINRNNFFLGKLSTEAYLSAGEAANALADSVISEMEVES
ncbi:MAG: tetratricopeptide repeat protein [bacterium]